MNHTVPSYRVRPRVIRPRDKSIFSFHLPPEFEALFVDRTRTEVLGDALTLLWQDLANDPDLSFEAHPTAGNRTSVWLCDRHPQRLRDLSAQRRFGIRSILYTALRRWDAAGRPPFEQARSSNADGATFSRGGP
jgi:hypothetical protein